MENGPGKRNARTRDESNAVLAEDPGCGLRPYPGYAVGVPAKGAMSLFESLVFVLLVSVIVSDWLLARRLRKALTLGRFASPALENFAFGGSPPSAC